jgi:hypothetical protein
VVVAGGGGSGGARFVLKVLTATMTVCMSLSPEGESGFADIGLQRWRSLILYSGTPKLLQLIRSCRFRTSAHGRTSYNYVNLVVCRTLEFPACNSTSST